MSHALVFVILGLTSGGAYSLTSIGIVTVYRGSGVLNFAQCAIGMAGAYAFYALRYGGLASLPTGVAVALGVGFSALLGLIIYVAIMRPLLRQTELARVIATVGVLLLLQGLATVHYGPLPTLVPPFLPSGGIHFANAVLPYSTVVILVALLVITLLLVALFRYTRLGLSATALQDRPDAAKVLGISPVPTGIMVWATGGALASVAAILLLPVTELAPSQATSLLFPALAAGLLGRFRNYGAAVGAGMAIGIFESVLIGYGWPTYLVNAIPFGIIIVALIIGGTTLPARGLTVARLPKLGDGRSRPYVVVAAVALIVGSLFWSSEGWAVAVSASAISGLIGLSIVVVTGYAGQITFLPYAIAGLAALAGAHAAVSWDLPFLAVLILAIGTGAVAGAISALPAMRVRGLDLAVLTLGIALAIETSVFVISALNDNGEGITVPSPGLFGLEIDTTTHEVRYAVVAVILFAVAALAVCNIRRSRTGRRLVSIRGNERGATAIGVSVVGAKVGAFALSGALAGLAGGLLIYSTTVLDVSSGFSTYMSMTALAWAIVGGVGMVSGGTFVGVLAAGGIGAYWFRNYQTVNSWLLVLGGAFVIYVMLTHPDGEVDRFAGLIRRVAASRKSTSDFAREATISEASTTAVGNRDPLREVTRAGRLPEAPLQSTLVVDCLSVEYGQVLAVDRVSLSVNSGSIVGIIGPNGAGKTSLIDSVTGFCGSAKGRVLLDGDDITKLPAAERARRGLGRTFQNMELFEDLTVRENLLAASDPRDPLSYWINLVLPGSRNLPPEADFAVRTMGLMDLLDERPQDLPTGTQRLVAIARAIAARPKVLCLDEPTAGLNGNERQRFVQSVRELQAEINLGIMIVEHNVDVVAELCDEVVLLNFGEVVAKGATAAVLASEIVRSAYLGETGATAQPLEEVATGESSD